jgi:hypothetical protein
MEAFESTTTTMRSDYHERNMVMPVSGRQGVTFVEADTVITLQNKDSTQSRPKSSGVTFEPTSATVTRMMQDSSCGKEVCVLAPELIRRKQVLTLAEAEQFSKLHGDTVTCLSTELQLQKVKTSRCEEHKRSSQEQEQDESDVDAASKNEHDCIIGATAGSPTFVGALTHAASFFNWTEQKKEDTLNTTAPSSCSGDTNHWTAGTTGTTGTLSASSDGGDGDGCSAGTTSCDEWDDTSHYAEENNQGRDDKGQDLAQLSLVVLLDMQEYQKMQSEMCIMRSRLLAEQNKVAKLLMEVEQLQQRATQAEANAFVNGNLDIDMDGIDESSLLLPHMSATSDEMDLPAAPAVSSQGEQSRPSGTRKSIVKRALRKINRSIIFDAITRYKNKVNAAQTKNQISQKAE